MTSFLHIKVFASKSGLVFCASDFLVFLLEPHSIIYIKFEVKPLYNIYMVKHFIYMFGLLYIVTT